MLFSPISVSFCHHQSPSANHQQKLAAWNTSARQAETLGKPTVTMCYNVLLSSLYRGNRLFSSDWLFGDTLEVTMITRSVIIKVHRLFTFCYLVAYLLSINTRCFFFLQKLVPGAKLSDNLVGQNASLWKYNCNFYLFVYHLEYI